MPSSNLAVGASYKGDISEYLALRDRGTPAVRKSHIGSSPAGHRMVTIGSTTYTIDYGSLGESLSCTRSSIDEGP